MVFHQKSSFAQAKAFPGSLHFSGKVVGCHGEAFVTSDQKNKGQQKPTKLLNTTFVMHEIGRSTQPHAEGEEKKNIHPKGSEDLKPRGLSPNNPISSWPSLAVRSRKLFPWETGDSQR